jgi:predicted acylesterase/phospholipase RssA
MSLDVKTREIQGISFSASGVHGFAQIGVLASLMEQSLITNVTRWYGCSGGCIPAVCGILQVTPVWLRDCIDVFDMSAATAIHEEMVADVDINFGVVSPEPLIQLLGRLADTWVPGFSSWTFKELHEHNPTLSLHIIASNITKMEITMFNYEKTPNIRVLDAVRASIAIPGFFTPWFHEGNIYSDGGIIEHTVWDSIPSSLKPSTLVVLSNTSIASTPPAITNFIDFVGRIMVLSRKKILEFHNPPQLLLPITATSVESSDFRITAEQRLRLFEEGQQAFEKWFNTPVNRSSQLLSQLLIGETVGTPVQSSDPRILSVSHPYPNRTSDTQESHSPLRVPFLSRDLQTGWSQSSRRWSL